MAYIIGLVTHEEEAELLRRGWVIEQPPPSLVDDPDEGAPPDGMQMIMIWVDSDLFAIMDGPDWDKGPAKEGT
jgi:hypothetical protein